MRLGWFCGLLVLLFSGSARAQGDRPAAIRYSEVRTRVVNRHVDLTGTVVSRRTSTVAGEIAGLVIDYPVRAGDRVEEGQIVARLRDSRLRLDLRAARAQLAEDQIRLAQAERNLQRARELFQRNVFSRQQLDDANFEFEALGKRLDRLEAVIARLQDDIDRSVIRAPFDGAIIRELTQVGEWLAEGGGVIELLASGELEIEVPVPESYFTQLDRSRPAQIRFEAIPGLNFEARIRSVIPRADTMARTFPVRFPVSRPDRRLGAGMVAQVSLSLGGTHTAVLVPKDAIVRQGREEFVFLLDPDHTVRRVAIESGVGLGAWVEVRGEVSDQDLVVTRGNERLRPGQNVVPERLDYVYP